jgi:hypothetical protein
MGWHKGDSINTERAQLGLQEQLEAVRTFCHILQKQRHSLTQETVTLKGERDVFR